MPDWYPLLKAAKWMGVAPWDLQEQHPIWKTWAISAIEAEHLAEENLKPKKPMGR